MKILLTGMAGFIGFNLCDKILARYPGAQITGLDNINDYYSTSLKKDRLKELGFAPSDIAENKIIKSQNPALSFIKADLKDKAVIDNLIKEEKFDYIIHLAAQAGVNYSLQNPQAYVDSNITGFLNILEACRNYGVKHLIYASSSSVYGENEKMPFSEADRVDSPVSLYAVTKKTNEAMARVYSHLFNVRSTGLRFFTVYGPWYRPDMALYIFAKKIFAGETIGLFNYGKMKRDFTYIDDINDGIVNLIEKVPHDTEIYNIGNNNPSDLLDVVKVLEEACGKKAKTELLPMRPGDVVTTYADIEKLNKAVGFEPKTGLCEGIEKFVKWYRAYYKV
ncbi:UDP-glucuronate 4-epimerase [Elusimicrobium posterum]|uniref:NAD-dependent epimerase/dehydratase family protein n=1 Tax=Elusimicrobium posterum TaxID=3116653 RepID=UPI003C75248B